MVKIKAKIFKHGNSYAVTIPKAFIDGEIFQNGEDITFYVEKHSDKDPKDLHLFRSSNYALWDNFGRFTNNVENILG